MKKRICEELFIVKPDAPGEEVDQFVEQMRGVIVNTGGVAGIIDKWGKRKLAYRVEKYREGNYVLFQFTGGAGAVKEFERRPRVAGLVVKFLTVRIGLTLKRLEKRKEDRDQWAARKPQLAAPAPAPAPGHAAETPAMPGLPKEA